MLEAFHPNNEWRTLLFFIGYTIPCGALAQNTPSEIKEMGLVVVTATRTETPISQVTHVVTVITEQEIQQQAGLGRNLGEVLAKTVPGLGPGAEAFSRLARHCVAAITWC